ncbi:MAG TPA: LysR family transcriptional regulator [Rhodobacterales bacterium]|nr:LysR family transcriptional regulator [Rhodobacterales bacterium]
MDETISDLSVFLAVVEAGSFRAAAEDLRSSPATVSRRVAALESALGTELIQRTTRQFFLTDAGARLVPEARGPLASLKRAMGEVSDGAERIAGVVRIAATHTVAETLVLPILAGLYRDYPDLRLELDLSEAIVDIRARAVDLAIRIGDLRDPTMVARKLGTDHVAFYTGPNAGGDGPILSYGDAEFEPEPPLLRARDMRMLKTLVRQGLGGAWLPDSLCREDLAAGRLRRDAGKTVFAFDAYIVRHANRQLPRRVRIVMERLIARGRALRSEG